MGDYRKLTGLGIMFVLAAPGLWWWINASRERYLWIISGPPPYNRFGSGPLQLWMGIVLIVTGTVLFALGLLMRRKMRLRSEKSHVPVRGVGREEQAKMPCQHFTATGIVFNSRGEVLMIKHTKLGVWLPPGGHVEENELPNVAVLREIHEETGVRAEILPNRRGLPLTSGHAEELDTPFAVLLEDIERDGSHNHIDMIYACRAMTDTLKPDGVEANDARRFSCEQIHDIETFDNVRKTIAYVAKTVGLASHDQSEAPFAL
jgi:8-oxo-dGTP diphosphatase